MCCERFIVCVGPQSQTITGAEAAVAGGSDEIIPFCSLGVFRPESATSAQAVITHSDGAFFFCVNVKEN